LSLKVPASFHNSMRMSGPIGAVPPIVHKSDRNPGGMPMEVFDGIRLNTANNRAQFFKDLAVPFYGFNRAGANAQQGVIDSFGQSA